MNDTVHRDAHAPDPRFAEHLEWQLRTALRRRARFAEPLARRAFGLRLPAVAAALVAAMTLGAGGVLAAQELERSRAAALLAEQYRLRFEIAQRREEAAREEVAELMRANEEGLVSPHEVYAGEEKRIELAQAASVLGLDAIEVGYTGRDPDRRMSAALVAGRDLVTERLEQELSALAFRSSAAQERSERLAALHERGFVTDAELARARLLELRLAGATAVGSLRKDLRARFLRGELGAARVDLLALEAEGAAHEEDARQEQELANTALERAQRLAASANVSQAELRSARHAARLAESELCLAALELETIRARLAEVR